MSFVWSMEILLLKIQLRHIKILLERMIIMKYKLKIYTVLLLICILTITLLSGCASPYDKLTEEDEKKILFVMYIERNSIAENGKGTCLCADNRGNIYKWCPDKKIVEAIESNEIFECEIVGHIPVDEVIEAYGDLCQIDEELFFFGRNVGGTEMDPYISFSGVRYIEGKIELIDVGDSDYYSENRYAKDIVDWMETWDWREYLEL